MGFFFFLIKSFNYFTEFLINIRVILVEFRMTSGTCGVFERICYVLLLQRDDLSGMQLSGNKVRKLEFLMADAVAQGADCIITIGGIQSNHCRAAAVAAKYLNLDCYLILRTSKVKPLSFFLLEISCHAFFFHPFLCYNVY